MEYVFSIKSLVTASPFFSLNFDLKLLTLSKNFTIKLFLSMISEKKNSFKKHPQILMCSPWKIFLFAYVLKDSIKHLKYENYTKSATLSATLCLC